MMNPIKLYWWNGANNFGDAISQNIVSYVSGRPVEWATPEDCELLAIGSILNFAGRAIFDRSGPIKHIWGSGSFFQMAPSINPRKNDHLKVHLVRGPLTAINIWNPELKFGDPGLVCDRVFGPSDRRCGGVGIVPHVSHWRDREYMAHITTSGHTVIDVRAQDHTSIVHQIASCDAIFSSSLHGLIVADSYGIPNFWLRGPQVGDNNLKFFDYALSVGRLLYAPDSLEECSSKLRRISSHNFDYFGRVANMKETIFSTFPNELKLHSYSEK